MLDSATQAIENPDSGSVTGSRNVKRWRGGPTVVCWASAAIIEAEKEFRSVLGRRDADKLIRALDVLEAKQETTAERVA